MSIYRFELSWDSVSPHTFAPANAAHPEFEAAIGFTISFRDSHAGPQQWGITLALNVHSFGIGPTYEYQTNQHDNTIPLHAIGHSATGDVTSEANGGNGTAFLTLPITLFILIDDGANTITMSGPLSTTVYAFSHLGIPNGPISTVALSDLGMGLTNNDGAIDLDLPVDFYDFYLSVDGTLTQGAQLGSLQPGSWVGGTLGVAPWIILQSNLAVTSNTDSHTETRLLGGIHYLHGGNIGVGEVYRHFGGGLGDVETVLAALCHGQTGTLVYARVVKSHVNAVEVGYSEDQGHTWTTVRVGETAGRFYNSPSLAEGPDGSINLFFSDRQIKQTRWFKSETRGRTWVDAGLLLDVLPWSDSTHPRVFTLASGFFLVSYNRAGHWFLASYDGGQHASFGIRTTDIIANTGGLDAFPGLFQAPNGYVYAVQGYSTLNETLEMSPNYGVNWIVVYQSALNSLRTNAVSSPFSPFVWKAWQTVSGDILAGGTADGGVNYVRPATTVFAGAAAQYFGMAVLPKGFPLILFQTYVPASDTWTVTGYVSPDLGRTWIAS